MTLESKKNRYDIFSLLRRTCVTLGKLICLRLSVILQIKILCNRRILITTQWAIRRLDEMTCETEEWLTHRRDKINAFMSSRSPPPIKFKSHSDLGFLLLVVVVGVVFFFFFFKSQRNLVNKTVDENQGETGQSLYHNRALRENKRTSA